MTSNYESVSFGIVLVDGHWESRQPYGCDEPINDKASMDTNWNLSSHIDIPEERSEYHKLC